MLSFYAVDTISMPKICINFQLASQAVCVYAHDFRKQPGCALIGACALIRMNTVSKFLVELRSPNKETCRPWHLVVSLSKTHEHPRVLVNSQEAVASSRSD